MVALGLSSSLPCKLPGASSGFEWRASKALRQTRHDCRLSPQLKLSQIIRRSNKTSTACRSTAVDTAEAEADVMELELKVEGMTCTGCSTRVAEALKAMAGVDKVNVDLPSGIATIEVHATDPIEAFNSMPSLVEKIGQLGFKAQAHFEDWA